MHGTCLVNRTTTKRTPTKPSPSIAIVNASNTIKIPITKTRRRYSDREKASALALNEATGNLTEVANTIGIPDSTICDWFKGNRGAPNPDIPLMRRGYQLERLDLVARL